MMAMQKVEIETTALKPVDFRPHPEDPEMPRYVRMNVVSDKNGSLKKGEGR